MELLVEAQYYTAESCVILRVSFTVKPYGTHMTVYDVQHNDHPM